MRTKQDLASVVLRNAVEEAQELLSHAEGVADFILLNFPDNVPESFIEGQRKSTESALLGAYREPEVSGRMMLDRCLDILRREKPDE